MIRVILRKLRLALLADLEKLQAENDRYYHRFHTPLSEVTEHWK